MEENLSIKEKQLALLEKQHERLIHEEKFKLNNKIDGEKEKLHKEAQISLENQKLENETLIEKEKKRLLEQRELYISEMQKKFSNELKEIKQNLKLKHEKVSLLEKNHGSKRR